MRPLRDGLAALAFDHCMNGADALQRARGGVRVGEDDLLRIPRGREEAADRIARHFPCEEQPVDRAIQRELGGGAGEDEEHYVSVAPDPAHDGSLLNETVDTASGHRHLWCEYGSTLR